MTKWIGYSCIFFGLTFFSFISCHLIDAFWPRPKPEIIIEKVEFLKSVSHPQKFTQVTGRIKTPANRAIRYFGCEHSPEFQRIIINEKPKELFILECGTGNYFIKLDRRDEFQFVHNIHAQGEYQLIMTYKPSSLLFELIEEISGCNFEVNVVSERFSSLGMIPEPFLLPLDG